MTTTAPIAPPSGEVVPVLALAEARRLLLHPVMLTGFLLWGLISADTLIGDQRPLEVFEAVGSGLSWTPGVLAILAAYLVATREQRAGTLDVLGSLPAREPERVRALCLAALAPGLVGLLLNLGLTGLLAAQDAFAVNPSVAHLLLPPLTLVGAVLFGLLVAVWAPVPLAPALGVVGMVALHVVVSTDSPSELFAPAMFWAAWGDGGGALWVGFQPGSPAWHLVYVVGLCGLAATAALVRVTPASRRSPVLVGGLAALAVTVAGAVLQLP